MPVISMLYGLIVCMYYLDNKQHSSPHIHVKYQGDEAVFRIPWRLNPERKNEAGTSLD